MPNQAVLHVTEMLNDNTKGFPASELKLIDMTLRMFTEPVLELDKDMLDKAIDEEKEKRGALLAKVGVEESSLSSNDKFATVLRELGVEPPTKISKVS